MIEGLGNKLGKWLFQKGFIQKSQIDIVRYAFEILCSEIVEIVVIIFFGIGTGKWIETVMFVCLLWIVRNQLQGYHMKTILRCFVATTSAYLATMILYPYVDVTIGMLILCICALLEMEYCYKRKATKPLLVIGLLHTAAGIVYFTYHSEILLQILIIVELLASLSLIPERRKDER